MKILFYSTVKFKKKIQTTLFIHSLRSCNFVAIIKIILTPQTEKRNKKNKNCYIIQKITMLSNFIFSFQKLEVENVKINILLQLSSLLN
jgi:hypothetical protein